MLVFLKYLVVLSVMLLSSCGHDQPLLLNSSTDNLSRMLDTKVPTLMKQNSIAGLSIVIIKKGDRVILKSFGYSDIESQREIRQHR